MRDSFEINEPTPTSPLRALQLQAEFLFKSLFLSQMCSNRSHIGIEELTLLHWIPVCQRVKQIKLNNMYRIVHGNAPQYLKQDFSMVNDQHSFFIRNSFLSVVLPHVKSSGKKTFRFSAGKIWNALPVSLRSAEDLLLFKESTSI